MKLAKAIKVLATDLIPNYPYAVGEKARAIQLGIEALKVVQSNRIYGYPNKIPKLPGETEE